MLITEITIRGPLEIQAEVEMAGISTVHLRAGWQDQIAPEAGKVKHKKKEVSVLSWPLVPANLTPLKWHQHMTSRACGTGC